MARYQTWPGVLTVPTIRTVRGAETVRTATSGWTRRGRKNTKLVESEYHRDGKKGGKRLEVCKKWVMMMTAKRGQNIRSM